MKNIVFVGGAGRSGTTYLAHALSKFDHISTGVESQWLSELIQLDLPHSQWVSFAQKHWKVTTSPRKVTSSQWDELSSIAAKSDIRSFCSKLLSFLAKKGVPLVVDHTPANIVNFKILSATFPQAKFLHIIRDGRGVFASLKNVMWGANTPFAAAEYWARFLAHGFMAKSLSNSDQYREVHYEKLLEDPNEIIDIVKWLSSSIVNNEKLVQKTLDVQEAQTEVPKHTQGQHALVNKGPQTSRINAWKKDLSKKEIKVFEKHVGNLLSFYGYELEEENNVYISRKYRLRMEAKEFFMGSIINPIRNVIRTRSRHLDA